MINSYHIFSRFSGLRPNLSKCEIAGIRVLKGIKVAVCGMQCVDLVKTKITIKILGTHFSFNERLKEDERNFCLIIANNQRVLKLWKLRNLTLEGKILIFKKLALSKIIFQAFVTPMKCYVVIELEKIQKIFSWQISTSKVKHDTLWNDYKRIFIRLTESNMLILSDILRCNQEVLYDKIALNTLSASMSTKLTFKIIF